MKSLEELKVIRDNARNDLNIRKPSSKCIRVVVGMGDCGINNGARDVINMFVEECGKRNIKDILITQSDCMGMCEHEPIVEVLLPNQKKVTYADVTLEKVIKIIDEHIVNGNPVVEYMMNKSY